MTSDETGPLTRSDPSGSGIRRRRCGRGFRYFGPDSAAIKDARTLARIKSLVIPPAWGDVWICPDPRGHIQALGTDSAGRRQYRYHDMWRERRDRAKHDRVAEFGAELPHLRKVVRRHLNGSGLTRDRVLAAAIRLIDLGFFRPGGEEYAEENGTFGLATIRKKQVTLSRGQLVFEYPAKGAKHREQAVAEDEVCAVVPSCAACDDAEAAATGSSPTKADRAGTTSRPPISTPTWMKCPAAISPPRTSAPGTPPSWRRWDSPCP